MIPALLIKASIRFWERRQKYFFAFFIFVTACETPSIRAAEPASAISSIESIFQLDAATLAQKLPVDVKGVITFAFPEQGIYFLSDGFGIYIYPNKTSQVTQGDWVHVTGAASGGQFTPIIDRALITKLGTTNTPPARPATGAEFASGALDSQWIKLRGVVQAQQRKWRYQEFFVDIDGYRQRLWVIDKGVQPANMVGATIEVQGVAGTFFNPDRTPKEFLLYVNSLEDIKLLTPGPANPFEGVPLSLEIVTRSHRSRLPRGLLVTTGLVSRTLPDGTFCIQTTNSALLVDSLNKTNFASGTIVKIAGFPEEKSSGRVLRDALVQVSGTNQPASPIPLSAAILPKNAFRLVSVAGLVHTISAQTNFQQVVVDTPKDGTLVVDCPSDLLVRPGQSIELTGILMPMDYPGQTFKRIILASLSDIRISGKPFNNPYKPLALSILFCLLLLSAIYLLIKTRRYSRARWKIRTLEHQIHEIEHHLWTSVKERERIAQDLHDDVIQYLYGVGLQLEGLRTVKPDDSARDEKFQLSITGINAVISRLREFVRGIENKLLTGWELRTAVKSLSLTVDEHSNCAIAVNIDDEAASKLTPLQSTELLYIIKEAISNANRHSGATTLEVSLKSHRESILVKISDNGQGFDPSAKYKGLGLRNMSRRASKIGATFDVYSKPDKGTTLTLLVPSAHEFQYPNKIDHS